MCTRPPNEPELAQDPLCPECGVRLGQQPPLAEARQALADLDAALELQNRRLASRVVHKVVGRRQEPPVERFTKAVQVSDLTGLANVLDEPLVALIREILRQP